MSNKPQFKKFKNNTKKKMHMYLSSKGRDAYGSILCLERSGEDSSVGLLGECEVHRDGSRKKLRPEFRDLSPSKEKWTQSVN